MHCLVDTNVLVYSAVTESPYHQAARQRLSELRDAGALLSVSSQVLREYVSVVTRPKVLARPRATAEAIDDVRSFLEVFHFIRDPPDTLERWSALVAGAAVTGAAVHDGWLVATALAAGLDSVLTNNPRHFERFGGIRVMRLLEGS